VREEVSTEVSKEVGKEASKGVRSKEEQLTFHQRMPDVR